MQRLTFAVMAVLAIVVSSGCFRVTTKITVRQDGSGVIDQDVGASAPALALLRNFGGGRGDTKADVQLFGPEQAQAAAAAMGVRFVSGEPVKTPEMEGYRAHYAFDDVTAIKFNMKQGTPSQVDPAAPAPSEPPLAFGFTKGPSSSTLTIRVPQEAGQGGLLPKVPGGGSSPEQNAQALSMITPMLHGLFVDVTLAVDGRVIKSTAPGMTGPNLTLVQFDFDKVAASDGGLQKLQQITDPKELKGIPGITLLSDPVVTIEFAR
jgi:hypothetical protein